MDSGTVQDAPSNNASISVNNRPNPLEFTLSYDHYTIIQHHLPKGYSLLQKRGAQTLQNKRERGSNIKFPDSQNHSRISGVIENAEQTQGRSKRNRIKKIDRYLQDQMPKPNKRSHSEKHKKQQITNPFIKILTTLKKNANSYPFLEPVDPNFTGASNYFEIIKQPMDLATVQAKYNKGQYENLKQFNDDIKKIWRNSYEYNDAASKIHKMTIQMQKLHNRLMSSTEGTQYKLGHSKQKSYRNMQISKRSDLSRKSQQINYPED